MALIYILIGVLVVIALAHDDGSFHGPRPTYHESDEPTTTETAE